jgi:cobalt-zinc-cadmium efflux system outer membrane protein
MQKSSFIIRGIPPFLPKLVRHLVLLGTVSLLPGLRAGAVADAGAPEPPAQSADALVAQIIAQNPERQFYEAEIDAAKAGVRVARAWNDPEISLDAGRKRVRGADGVLAGEGVAWSVSVTQTFEWPGRIPLRKAIANRDVELARLGFDRFNQALSARARELAFGLHAANARAAAIREVAGRFAALRETFLARDPAGLTPLLETRVIEAAELALQRRATGSALAVQAALIELNQLRGVAPGAALRVAAPALEFRPVSAGLDALLAAARENNFDYRMRRVELEQQGYAVRLAKNERYPSVSLSPYYSDARAGDRETIVGAGVSLPLPLSSGKRGAVQLAEARRRQAETAALTAWRELEREVVTAARVFETRLAETRRWPADTVARFRDAAALADRHYRLGAVPIATYLELQNSYLDAVEAILDTQRETLAAGLRLEQLTGLPLNLVAEEIAP